jgi:protein-disulfide isomerase
MARVPKPKQADEKRPSGRMVVLAFAVAVGAAVALVVAALFLRNDGGGALTPSPTPAVDLSGIPQEGTFLGAGSATVTLIEYADLQCPFCRSYSEAVFPTIVDEYVRPGKVRTEFRGLAFIGPDSEKALRYVLAAGLQNRLWDLQEALYRNQGAENSGWVSEELVRTLAAEIPHLDVDRLFEDAESDEVTALMEQSADQAQAADVPGTPTFYVQIGKQEPYKIEVALDPSSFRPALDDALAG